MSKAKTASRDGRERLLGPIAGGMLLDALDLATFGPVGLWTGLVVGGAAGWLLAPGLGIAPERRWLAALGAGAYCMLPFTAFLPLGTLVGTLVRLREATPEPPSEELPGASPSIEAEYSAHWDDDEVGS